MNDTNDTPGEEAEPPPGEDTRTPLELHRDMSRGRYVIPDDFDPIAMHRRWMGYR